MGNYEKVFIYFDTNALECRHSGKSLFLSQFTVNPLYYEIEKLIQDLGFTDKAQICIPEIVWLEMHKHLISHFKSEKKAMFTKLEAYKKSFGDLIELTCTFREFDDEEKYKVYLHSISNDFLENPRVTASIIPYSKDEVTISEIIKKAVQSIKPFRTAKVNGKEYTDAGLKDALIFNTILKHTGNQLGIFISNDTDFSDLFKENHYNNLHLCSKSKEVQEILSKEFNILSSDMIEPMLKSDEYLMKRILTEADLDENAAYRFIETTSCSILEDGIKVDFIMIVDGEKYIFDILYNSDANELIEVSCELYEESDV